MVSVSGWVQVTRVADKRGIVINLANVTSLEPNDDKETMIWFLADREDGSFLVKETPEEILDGPIRLAGELRRGNVTSSRV